MKNSNKYRTLIAILALIGPGLLLTYGNYFFRPKFPTNELWSALYADKTEMRSNNDHPLPSIADQLNDTSSTRSESLSTEVVFIKCTAFSTDLFSKPYLKQENSLGTIPKAKKVRVIQANQGKQGDWSFIEYHSVTGYVPTKALKSSN